MYERFITKYKKINKLMGKDQYVVPYLMSSHPGSTMKEAVELAEYIRDLGYMPEQVQDFYPTPSTLSTCMYYTGVDPRTMEKVYVPKKPHEKEMQRALIQYRNPDNYDLVNEALHIAHRTDLIGFDEKCLIRPRKFASEKAGKGDRKQNGGSFGNGLRNQKSGSGGNSQNGRKNGNGSKKQNAGFAGNGKQRNGSQEKQKSGFGTGKQKKKTLRNVHKKK